MHMHLYELIGSILLLLLALPPREATGYNEMPADAFDQRSAARSAPRSAAEHRA